MTKTQVYRVVLDTNIIIAAGTNWLVHGQPVDDPNRHRRILTCVAQSHRGLYCGKIVGEYLEKLVDRPHPLERALKMITYIMGAFERVEITTEAVPVPPNDPDDEIFLLCAIDGDADYLVSDDQHLTSIKNSYTKPVIGHSAELVTVLSR